MNALRRFGSFWYHFIVGDDWRIAVGVIGGLGVSAILVHDAHAQVWWLLPLIVVFLLAGSLWFATRRR
jgi:hypothetical protein